MIDDEMYGYKTFNNGMLFWKGNFLSRNTESFVEWNDLINHIESMILLNQLNDRIEPLKSVTEQLTLVDNYEENVSIDLEFTQEFVDRYLTERSAETKYLIYEEFNKSLSSKSNQEFLKSMYGIGGSSYTISGSGIGEEHNAKGITFYRGYFGASATKQLFKWNYIEKRIKELIKENRYLNSRELEEYPKWLDKKEEEREFDLKVNELSKSTEELPVEYEYHLGDKVYLGADEYEILDIGIANILLYDYRYPLFNREISKEEFDDEEYEMLCITANTTHPSTEIEFYMNESHMATTYTDTNGKAEVGTSNTTEKLRFYCICDDEQSEELVVNPKKK